jgi:hypothetical protein
MANNVTSNINVRGAKDVIDLVEKMFNHENGGEKNGLGTEWLARTILDENIKWEDIGGQWVFDNIGPKWCYLEDDCREDDNTYYISTISAWSAPTEYLDNLLKKLTEVDESVEIECTYEDEMPNFVGSYYGNKSGSISYQDDDIEIPDEDDFDSYEEYEEAYEEFNEGLYDIKQNLLSECKSFVNGD